jgi:hypothetical protein
LRRTWGGARAQSNSLSADKGGWVVLPPTAKQRCAYERAKFDAQEFKVIDDFLMHVNPATSEPIDPAHEAIEGRRLKKDGGGKYVLDPPIMIGDPMVLPE